MRYENDDNIDLYVRGLSVVHISNELKDFPWVALHMKGPKKIIQANCRNYRGVKL